MIPIVSITLLISGLFFAFITLKIFYSYRKTKEEKIKNFLMSTLFLTITFLLTATPGIIFTDLIVINFLFLLYPLFVFLSLAYFGTIPLKIMDLKKTEKIFFYAIVAIALLVTFFNLLKWGPAIVHYEGRFVYWEDARGITMNTIIGIIFSLMSLLIIIFFIVQGLKSQEKYVRQRTFFLIGGLVSFIIASIINFVVGASPQIYITSLISTFFFILAGVFVLAGVYYRKQ